MKRAAAGFALLGALAAVAAEDRGAALFGQHCAACHQARGEGTPGLAPRIAGRLADKAGSDAGRAYLAQVLVSGLAGPITVDGERFNSAMPGFGQLGDADLQALLAHLSVALNGAGAGAEAEAIAKARERRLAPNAVRQLRAQ